MNDNRLRQALIASCEKYYAFLNTPTPVHRNSLPGRVLISVRSITRIPAAPCELRCWLSKPMKDPSTCRLYENDAPNHFAEVNRVELVQYGVSERSHYVILRAADISLSDRLLQLPPQKLLFVSDLTFLIENLRKFYQKHPLFLSPRAPLPLPPSSLSALLSLSEAQHSAVELALTHPVSYIWGPPGTGKTNYVLSACLLRYLSAGKRVFLLAPTNNAIEQMLRGILPILREADIDLHQVYRLGTASAEFARAFPEVVGSSELEAEVSLLRTQANRLQQELDEVNRREQILVDFEQRIHETERFVRRLKEYYAHMRQTASLQSALSLQLSALQSAQSALDHAASSLSAAKERLSSCDASIKEITQLLHRSRFLLWKRAARKEAAQKLPGLVLLQSKREDESNAQQSCYDICLNRKTALSADVDALRQKCTLFEHRQTALYQALLCSAETASMRAFVNQLEHISEADGLAAAQSALSAVRAEQAAFLQKQFRSPEEISAELQKCKASAADLSSNGKLAQRKNAKILASTIDSALSYLPPDEGLRLSHIFIDEAGYTSLVRGLAAFACNCPVTFLGDHKQLPPICEMEHISLADKEVSLFVLPCAFFSEAVSLSLDSLYALYYSIAEARPVQDIPPSFSHMPMSQLCHSYRFSDTLAQILSTFLYEGAFTGNPCAGFEIIVLSAPAVSGSKKRTSPKEASAIRAYLEEAGTESTAILAPYSNQVKALKEALLRFPNLSEQILTVHRAQGREWDTVILSVTDSAIPFHFPYFTNSTLPIGRSVLNTALSRARKRLVLACDDSFWCGERRQLISALISRASQTLHFQ